MTDKEVMQQALEALECVDLQSLVPDYGSGHYSVARLNGPQVESAITALRTALEQQAASKEDMKVYRSIVDNYWKSLAAAQPEQQAEPVPRWDVDEDNPDSLAKHPAFRATPEQQAEPVAYDKTAMNCFVQSLYDSKMQEGKHGHYETMFHVVHQAIKRFAPPQRQWVGLTDEDFLEACQIAERGNYLLALQRIQIKLKERNHG